MPQEVYHTISDNLEPRKNNPFFQVLAVEVATLQARHPVLADAIGRANAILLDGRLFPEDDGVSATVWGSNAETYTVNGSCTCKAAEYTPDQPCKHRISLKIYHRVAATLYPSPSEEERSMQALPVRAEDTPLVDETVEGPADSGKIPPQWIQMIHGKPFVRYPGLLAMAHEQGLVKLEARFISVTPDVALAEATATFADGRIFTEAGDATPENVKPEMQAHFARLALTRAKARCLRDALNIGMCSVDELA